MRLLVKLMLAYAFLLWSGTATGDFILRAKASSTSVSRSQSSSDLSFNGIDGRHVVNDDVLEVRQGQLSVNGVSHGVVSPKSTIRYSIQGDKKTLSVDGKPRPLRK